MSIKGLDELSKQLKQLQDNVENLNGSHPIDQVLSPEFMSRHTRFAGIYEFLEAGGFDISSSEAFEAIPEEDLDAYVRKETSFADWSSMQQQGAEEWAAKQLAL